MCGNDRHYAAERYVLLTETVYAAAAKEIEPLLCRQLAFLTGTGYRTLRKNFNKCAAGLRRLIYLLQNWYI